MTTKKTPAKKTTAKKAPAKKTAAKTEAVEETTSAEVIPIRKEATEVTDEALTLDPADGGSEDDIVEAEIIEDVGDPVANAIDILSATGLNTPRDAVRYLESYVESHPDIDDLVDRKTERAALLGFQAWLGKGETGLDSFLFDRWNLPQPESHGAPAIGSPPALPSNPRGEAGRRARQRAVDQPERWIPKVPPLAGPRGSVEPPTGSLQTMEQAFDEARGEGYFTERTVG